MIEPVTDPALAARRRTLPMAVVLLWALAAGLGFLQLPAFHDRAITDPREFFPPGSPSRTAARAIESFFPGATPASQIVLVFRAETPIEDLVLEPIVTALRSVSSPCVTAVVSPLDNPAARRRLTADRGRSALIAVRLDAGFGSEAAAAAVSEVEAIATRHVSAGVSIALSGDATLGRDYDRSLEEGGRDSARLSILLVAVILLLVYRSPVAAAVSLLSLAAALGVSFGLISLAAGAGLPVAYHSRSFLVAIIYGVGTDYALLLLSRAREEFSSGSADPVGIAARSTRPVIMGSAVAVAAACVLMGFARFGLFRFSGPALALGVLSSLAASLTLAPVLMRLADRRLFWPLAPASLRPSRFWPPLARGVLRFPLVSLAAASLLLLPLVNRGMRVQTTFENEIDIPRESPSESGYRALKRGFPLSAVSPVSLVIRADSRALPPGWRGPDGLAAVHALSERLAAAPGVARVHSAARPTGEAGLFESGTVRGQIRAIEWGLGEGRAGAARIAQGLESARVRIRDGMRGIVDEQRSLESERRGFLARAFAGARYGEAVQRLESFRRDLETLHRGLGEAADGTRSIARGLALGEDRLRIILSSPAAAPALDRLALAADDLAASRELDTVFDHYVSKDGTATLIEIEGAHDPNSTEAVETLGGLRTRLPVWLESLGLGDAAAWMGGATTITEELGHLVAEDLHRIGGLVLAGVFLLLVLMLRDAPLSAAVTLYLLASYYAALGLLDAGVAAGYWPGIDWKAPFFIFVLLASIGADYGLFLLGRSREEERTLPFREALARAVVATGPVVSSCGLVLAGTFSSLSIAPISFLQQVGVGVTAGVLLDTLVVRPFMLPATALFLRRFFADGGPRP